MLFVLSLILLGLSSVKGQPRSLLNRRPFFCPTIFVDLFPSGFYGNRTVWDIGHDLEQVKICHALTPAQVIPLEGNLSWGVVFYNYYRVIHVPEDIVEVQLFFRICRSALNPQIILMPNFSGIPYQMYPSTFLSCFGIYVILPYHNESTLELLISVPYPSKVLSMELHDVAVFGCSNKDILFELIERIVRIIAIGICFGLIIYIILDDLRRWLRSK